MLLPSAVGRVSETVVWPLWWAFFPVVRQRGGVLVSGVVFGGDVGDCEWRVQLGPMVASLSAETVCELLEVARV